MVNYDSADTDKANTWTAQQTFAGAGSTPGAHFLGAVVADQLTVQPGTVSPGNASLYMDNNTGSPQVWEFFCDGSGNWGVYDKTNSHSAITLTPSTEAVALAGVVSNNAGTSSAGSAPILTGVAGTNGGAAVQLSDTARDYMVYLQVGTAGTAFIVQMGHTSAGNDVTLHASGVATAGQTLTFRLPAGWYFLWSATTATLAQSVAVGC